MIILHSLKLLEQLTHLEKQIQEWETLLDSHNLQIDKEKILMMILKRNQKLEKEINSKAN